MNALLDTRTFLMDGLRQDPVLCLASTVASLDPLWLEDDEDDWIGDERDPLGHAFTVVRAVFPDIYVQAVDGLRHGMSDADLERLICQGLNDAGIPLDDLEWMGYGIPLPAYGINLADPDVLELHADIIPILQLFGVEVGHQDIPDDVYTIGRILATSLSEQEGIPWQQVAYALGWLFGCSGNSCVDTDYETLCEYEPLAWDHEDVAFARELIQEAETIMTSVAAGLDLLTTHEALIAALKQNIQKVYQALRHSKGRKRHDPHLRLAWPRLADRPE